VETKHWHACIRNSTSVCLCQRQHPMCAVYALKTPLQVCKATIGVQWPGLPYSCGRVSYAGLGTSSIFTRGQRHAWQVRWATWRTLHHLPLNRPGAGRCTFELLEPQQDWKCMPHSSSSASGPLADTLLADGSQACHTLSPQACPSAGGEHPTPALLAPSAWPTAAAVARLVAHLGQAARP
jgi:hypothetical protein